MANYGVTEIEYYDIFVYMLYDNVKKHPIYVGATQSPELRFRVHKGTTLNNYINKDAVTLEILEKTNILYAEQKEREWFAKIQSTGVELLQKSYCTRGKLIPKYLMATNTRNHKGRIIKKQVSVIRTGLQWDKFSVIDDDIKWIVIK